MSSASSLVIVFTNSNFTVFFTRDKIKGKFWLNSMVNVQHFTTKMLKAYNYVHNLYKNWFKKKVKSFNVLTRHYATNMAAETVWRNCTPKSFETSPSFRFCDVIASVVYFPAFSLGIWVSFNEELYGGNRCSINLKKKWRMTCLGISLHIFLHSL